MVGTSLVKDVLSKELDFKIEWYLIQLIVKRELMIIFDLLKMLDTGKSPLLEVHPEINLVESFVLDYMHLGFLGIIKKLVEYWIGSSSCAKLDQLSIFKVSQRLVNISKHVTIFNEQQGRYQTLLSRKPQNWGFFLLYVGPVILKDILPIEQYQHFMLLSVGSRILLSDDYYSLYTDLADEYLKKFSCLMSNFYGDESLINDIHAISHVSDDVKKMKCSLSNMSAFPFESKLGLIKKSCKSGNRSLEQLCNHYNEDLLFHKKPERLSSDYQVKICKSTNDCTHIYKIENKNYEISTKAPNNIVLTKSGNVVQIKIMFQRKANKNIIVCGKKIKIIDDIFSYPMKSLDLNMHEVSGFVNNETDEFLLSDVSCKMMKIPVFEISTTNKENYVVSLIHWVF